MGIYYCSFNYLLIASYPLHQYEHLQSPICLSIIFWLLQVDIKVWEHGEGRLSIIFWLLPGKYLRLLYKSGVVATFNYLLIASKDNEERVLGYVTIDAFNYLLIASKAGKFYKALYFEFKQLSIIFWLLPMEYLWTTTNRSCWSFQLSFDCFLGTFILRPPVSDSPSLSIIFWLLPNWMGFLWWCYE